MITFPPEFTAIKYPGYFWHTTEERLYTMKVTGVLRPLVMSKPNHFNHGIAGYKLSVKGKKRYMPEHVLKKLKQKDSVIPVQLTLF
jgi:hypothetical protein